MCFFGSVLIDSNLQVYKLHHEVDFKKIWFTSAAFRCYILRWIVRVKQFSEVFISASHLASAVQVVSVFWFAMTKIHTLSYSALKSVSIVNCHDFNACWILSDGEHKKTCRPIEWRKISCSPRQNEHLSYRKTWFINMIHKKVICSAAGDIHWQ